MRIKSCLAVFNFFTMMAGVAWVGAGEVELEATLTNADVIKAGIVASTSDVVASANFVLQIPEDPADGEQVHYTIDVTPLDLDGLQTPDLSDDVTAIHFHDTSTCASPGCQPGDTAGSLHVLNVFGVPRADDADMVFDASIGTVTGLWDASDANSLTPAPSFAPNDILQMVEQGRLFVMVHTRSFPSGAVGGYVVPEPSCFALVLGACLCMGAWNRIVGGGTRKRLRP